MNDFITYDIFKNENIIVFSSTKKAGSMKSGKIKNLNLKNFTKKRGLDFNKLVLPEQVHGANIQEIISLKKNRLKGKDAIITGNKSVYLGVITADCLPIVIYDPFLKLIAVVHAGYRGILLGIIDNALTAFKKLGSEVKNLKVLIGPSICGKCYKVGHSSITKFMSKFSDYHGFIRQENNSFFLDLKKLSKEILTKNGVRESNLEISPLCTFETSFLFSARKSNGKIFGEFVTIAAFK